MSKTNPKKCSGERTPWHNKSRHATVLVCFALITTLALLPQVTPPAAAQAEEVPTFSVVADPMPAGKGPAGLEPSTGSFTRVIPIEAPPFHGIEPRLTLAYSSQGGNGFVGVGWRLGGFSVVERTRNGRGTPRFTDSDVFVLDGQELLPCSEVPHSPGCAAGGTHATKQESYTRIRFDGSTWSIWSRNGVRTDLEPVYVTSAGGALRWGQSRTVDTHDNKVTYRWECVEGDCYPASVAYGPFVVTLLREVRPDVLSFATGDPNGLGNTRYRLGTILMSRGDVPIRAYRLGYSTSAASLRSLLQEVQQYGTDVKLAGGVIVSGTSLPPQTFAYQDEADDGSVGWGTGFVTPFTGTCAHVARAADFSGDGRTDMMCSADGVTQVAVSAGDGFAAPAVWLNQELGSPIIGDFNGDGASDLAVYDGTTKAFKVALSTGTGFAPLAEWGTATAVWEDGNIYSCGGSGSARSGSGNFDGNGYTDVFCRGGGGSKIFAGKSTGSSFTFSIFADYSCWGVYERSGPADFDGDGRDDWYCINGYGDLSVRLSNGRAFEDASFQGPKKGICDEHDYWVLADINGDGRTDATCPLKGTVLLSTGTGMFNTGSGGGWCNSWQTIKDPDNPDQTIEVLRSQMQPMDTDGDRIPELVCTYAGPQFRDVHVRKWTGEKLAPPQVHVAGWCLSSIQGGDFDGDGQFELLCKDGAVLRSGTPNAVPDLMVEATNGIGGQTIAHYYPSSVFAYNKPPVRQIVTSVTTDDGRGSLATTTYAYFYGRTDPVEGVFLGYGQVQATAPCLRGESACPSTTTFLSQELRSLGRPIAVHRTDGAGYVLQEVETFFHPQSGPALPRQALVKEIRTTDFAPTGGDSKTTSVSYAYDGYGNVTRQTSHGEVTREGVEIPNDELHTSIAYEPPYLSRYVVSLVRLTEQWEQRSPGKVLMRSKVPLKRVERGHDPSTFDLKSVKTSVLPGRGHLLRTMDYYADGNLKYIKSELGAETTITYTADGLHPETVTDPEGSVTTHWHPLCDAPTQVTDPNGSTTISYDELCRPRRTTGPLRTFAERFYLNLGDPNTQHVRVETPGSDGNDYSEEYFDGLGRVYRSLRRGPSAGQDILTVRSYDARGGLASATAPFYEGDKPDLTRYSYDSFDRVLTITHPDRTTTTKSYELWKETTTGTGKKPVTVERGTTSSVETTTIEGEVVTTTHQYDLLGRRVQLMDTLGNTWKWSYDSLDRILSQLDPDSGRRTFEYDDANRTQTETDAEKQVVTIGYDIMGRVSSKTSAVGLATLRYSESRKAYQNWGRLTTVVSPGSTPSSPSTSLEIDYDALGRVKRQTRIIPEMGYEGTVLKDYDASGRMSTLTYPYPDIDSIGPISYDGAGRIISIPGILESVTYDAAGRPLEQRNANGTVTTRTYLPKRGLLDTLTTTWTSGFDMQLIQVLDYDYEDDLPLVKTVAGLVPGESWKYHYDDGYRLDEATNLTDPADVQTFDYDSIGRIRFNSRVGTYDYPDPGQPRPHAPKTVNGAPYEYLANGNLKSGGGRTPAWDAEGRIAAIGTARFSYDAFGERLTKTSLQGTSLYPFGDDYEITNGVVTKYISVERLGVIAKRVGTGPGARTFWLHTDRLGSIQAVTSDGLDPNEPVVLRRTYRPYGETLSETGTHTESRGWIDQRNDSETGLTYLHARYYDPELGIFLSPDPIGVEGGMNQYGYSLGDPVNASDRSGLAQDCFTFEVERGSPPPWAGYQSGQGQTSGGGFLGTLVVPSSVWKTTIRVCWDTPDPPVHQPGDGSNDRRQDGYGQEGQGQGGGQNRGGSQNNGNGNGDDGDDGGGIIGEIKKRLPDRDDAIWNPGALFDNLGRLTCNAGSSFSSRFSENMRNANSFIPGLVAPTGVGLTLRAGSTVGAAIGAPTVMGALTGAWRGTTYAGGVVFLSGGEAFAASLGTAGLTGAAVGSAFEIGLMIGSAADAFGQSLACR